MMRRRGSMLVELCGAMAGGCAVMLIGISLIERSLYFGKQVQMQADLQRELGQLARAWREDAVFADIDNQSNEVATLKTKDESITYRWQAGVVRRESVKLDEPKTGLKKKISVVEQYRLGKDFRVSIDGAVLTVRSIDPSGKDGVVRLRVVGRGKERSQGVTWQEPALHGLEPGTKKQEVANVQ